MFQQYNTTCLGKKKKKNFNNTNKSVDLFTTFSRLIEFIRFLLDIVCYVFLGINRTKCETETGKQMKRLRGLKIKSKLVRWYRKKIQKK